MYTSINLHTHSVIVCEKRGQFDPNPHRITTTTKPDDPLF